MHPETETDPQARRRTAFHEAGHAVVGWALGLEVGWVRIVDDLNGKADIETCDHLPAVDQVAVAMGGWYGAEISGVEALHDGETLNDQVFALNVTTSACPDDDEAGEAIYREGCARAQALVAQHADLVSLVADELLLRGEIPAVGAARLLPTIPKENPAQPGD